MPISSVATSAEFVRSPEADESVVSAAKPGLKIRLSQLGLNYGASIAVDVLRAKLRQIKIRDCNGSSKIPAIGKIDYYISNITVTI